MKLHYTYLLFLFSTLTFSQTPVGFQPASGMSGTGFGTKLDIKNYDIAVASNKQPLYPVGMRSSKVYMFTFLNGTITPQGLLYPNDALESDYFGYSVSLGNDVMAIGSPLNDESATNAGAVYIYQKTINGDWALYQKLLPGDNTPYFGANVKMYGDFLFVSANADIYLGQGDITTNAPIKVYKNEGGQWHLFQTIPVIGNAFGGKMEIDDDVLVVSEIDSQSSNPIFHRIALDGNGQWVLQATSGPMGNADLVVRDFSFQDNVIYMAGQHMIDMQYDNVAALTYNGTTWNDVEFLFYMPESPGTAPSQRFTKIMVSGNHMFLGSTEYFLQVERKFPLLYFKKTSGIWTQDDIYFGTSLDPMDDYFGSVMAMDGSNLLVGAPGEGIIRQGKAYVLDMTLGTEQFDKNRAVVYPNPTNDKVFFQDTTISNAKVYSITGNLVLDASGVLTELSLAPLSSGMYLIKADTKDGQSQTFKVIKK